MYRTLNASEAVAKGAAMMSAMLSSHFRVAEYNIEDSNYFPIRIGWLYNDTLSSVLKDKMEIEGGSINHAFAEKQHPLIFDKNCSLPCTKTITFHKCDPMEITLYYDPIPAGF